MLEFDVLSAVNKAAVAPQTLFAKRPLINSKDIVDWAKGAGFPTTQDPKDMHVTLAYSKAPLSWPDPHPNDLTVVPGEDRLVTQLGDKGATVLRFNSPELTQRHQELKDAGAQWDFPSFKPHVTVSWKGDGVDVNKIKPYSGPLHFGPEEFKPVNPDWAPKVEKMQIPFVKLDAEQHLAWGWASVANLEGQPVVDLQKDIIDPEELVRCTTEFMEDVRKAQEMHNPDGKQVGVVVHSFPLTQELAKAFGITCNREGWMVGVKISDPTVWKRIKDRELVAFSIGGSGERVPL